MNALQKRLAWALPLLQAMQQGKTLQVQNGGIEDWEWQDWKFSQYLPSFNLPQHSYRIKPEPLMYRIYRNKNPAGFVREEEANRLYILSNEAGDKGWQPKEEYIEWVTDWTPALIQPTEQKEET